MFQDWDTNCTHLLHNITIPNARAPSHVNNVHSHTHNDTYINPHDTHDHNHENARERRDVRRDEQNASSASLESIDASSVASNTPPTKLTCPDCGELITIGSKGNSLSKHRGKTRCLDCQRATGLENLLYGRPNVQATPKTIRLHHLTVPGNNSFQRTSILFIFAIYPLRFRSKRLYSVSDSLLLSSLVVMV